MSWAPNIGDTVNGWVGPVFQQGGGIVYANQNQGEPYSAYAGPPNVPCNPLRFEFFSGSFTPGQQVIFTVAAGPNAPYATNVEAY